MNADNWVVGKIKLYGGHVKEWASRPADSAFGIDPKTLEMRRLREEIEKLNAQLSELIRIANENK